MRLAPIPVFFHGDIAEARRVAGESSHCTHPGALAARACRLLAHIVVRAMHASTKDPQQFLDACAAEYLHDTGCDELRRLLRSSEPDDSKERCWNWKAETLDIEGTLKRRGASYNGYPVDAGYFGSYCVDCLAVALWAVYHASSFGEAVERCVNLRGDADSTAAVAGQIAGALWGWSAIDRPFRDNLFRWDTSSSPKSSHFGVLPPEGTGAK